MRFRPFRYFRFNTIFWDNEKIKKMDYEEFIQYLNTLRKKAQNGDWNARRQFNCILLRFLERGNCAEGYYFFTSKEILNGIRKFKLWLKNPIRIRAWQRVAENLQKVGK